ncbi:MAG: amino acid ABC transporter substrate-binding protein [Desulfovibrio sp.]|nr:MAG: amino acid ABC transporter substrate-binding protein [Desulfovibrio sp.]
MNGIRILTLALTVVCLTAFMTVAAMAEDDPRQALTEASTIEQVIERGVLRVGFSTFVPWAMKDMDGNFIGFEIDVATRLAQDMGVDIEFVPTRWSGIIPALLTGKFDVLIGGMTITAERNLQVNFTDPYYYSGLSLVAHKEVAPGFDSLEDFNNPDVVLVCRLGTTAEQAARRYMPEAELVLFDEEPQALQELLNGRAHGFVSMAPLPSTQALKHPDILYLPLEENFTREPNGFAVLKGDIDTLNYFNNWIRVVQAEGWIQERYHYWFETLDWEPMVQPEQ